MTSDGTSNGSVGVILQSSGVYSKNYCNLTGSLCKTTEDLFAVDTQIAWLSGIYLTGGQVDTKIAWLSGIYLTGGQVDTKINTFSGNLMTHLSGSYYTTGQINAKGYLTSETDPDFNSWYHWFGATAISQWDSAYNWGNHATKGYLTGAQVDAKILVAADSLVAYMSGTYLPLTGCSSNDQIPKWSGSINKWICSPDQIGVVSLTNYYTKTEINQITGNYYTTGQINAKNYRTGGQITAYLTNNLGNELSTYLDHNNCNQWDYIMYDAASSTWVCESLSAYLTSSSSYLTTTYYDKTYLTNHFANLVNPIFTNNISIGGSAYITGNLTVTGQSYLYGGIIVDSGGIYTSDTGWFFGGIKTNGNAEVNGIGKFLTAIWTPQICDSNGTICLTISDIAWFVSSSTPGRMPKITGTSLELYSASTCTWGNAGQMRFNQISSRFEWCNGTQWMAFSGSLVPIEYPDACGSVSGTIIPVGSSLTLWSQNLCAGWTLSAFAYAVSLNSYTYSWDCGSLTCSAKQKVNGVINWSSLCGCSAGDLFNPTKIVDPYASGKYIVNWTCIGSNGWSSDSTDITTQREAVSLSTYTTSCTLN